MSKPYAFDIEIEAADGKGGTRTLHICRRGVTERRARILAMFRKDWRRTISIEPMTQEQCERAFGIVQRM